MSELIERLRDRGLSLHGNDMEIMSELIERLRDRGLYLRDNDTDIKRDCWRAADRIEKLEAALVEIANHKPEIGTAKIRAMARAALAPEQKK